MMKEILEPPSAKPTPEPLTAREVEVLHLLAKGLTNEEIAAKLVISEVTVRTHISHLLAKLHLANRVQATLYALREGIVLIQDEEER
jgi:NarL family two-component system response regulator LiaR